MAAAVPPRPLLEDASARGTLLHDLSYSGFSTQTTRELLVSRGWTQGDIVRALLIYIACGNNPASAKREKRTTNPQRLALENAWLREKGVKKNGTAADDLTLGRVAKAFAPVLLALRKEQEVHLRRQIESSTPIAQCDIAFLGMEGTRQLRDCRDFCTKMGLVITRAGFRGMSDAEILSRNEGFAEVARAGLQSDPTLKEALDLEFSVKDALARMWPSKP